MAIERHQAVWLDVTLPYRASETPDPINSVQSGYSLARLITALGIADARRQAFLAAL